MVQVLSAAEPVQVQIRLKAGVADQALRAADDVSLSVPATVGPKALQALLDHLLPDAPKPLPDFNFLAFDELLRTTLGNFLQRRVLSTEKTVPVTYFLPLPRPTSSPSRQLSPEWLSSVSVSRNPSETIILAGSYSGAFSVLTQSKTLIPEAELRSVAHRAPVKAISWIPGSSNFLTASTDQTARLWSFSEETVAVTQLAAFRSEQVGPPVQFDSVAVFPGETGPLAALGATNGSIWLLPDIPTVMDCNKGSGSDLKRKEPDTKTLHATKLGTGSIGLPISAVQWREDKQLLSAGWDSLVRIWNLEKGETSATIPSGGKALTDLVAAETSLLVSAVDGAIRLVDARDGKGVVGACGKRGAHRGIATSIAWMEENKSCVTGGVDGTVRLWDLRSLISPVHVLADVHGERGRIMAVCAVKEPTCLSVYSAGSDGKLVPYRL